MPNNCRNSWAFSLIGVVCVFATAMADLDAEPSEVRFAGRDSTVELTFVPGAAGASHNLYLAAEPGVTAESYNNLPGGRSILNIVSPLTIGGLDNNRDYYFYLVEQVNGSDTFVEAVATPRKPWQQVESETGFVSVSAHLSSSSVVLAAGVAANGCTGPVGGKVSGCDIYRSTDSGANWQPVTANIVDIDIRAVALGRSSAIALSRDVGAGEKILHSTDRGASWVLSDTGLATNSLVEKSVAFGVVDPTVVVAANIDLGRNIGETTVIRSTTGGLGWEHLSKPLNIDINARVIAIDPNNSDVIWAGGGGNPLLIRSADAGMTWSTVPTQGVAAVIEIAIDPQDSMHMWVADTENVRQSIDGGISFFPSHAGLPQGAIINAMHFDRSTQAIYVGTDTGVYESRDRGATFVSLSLGIESVNIRDLTIVEEPRAMVVASSAGLYRLDLKVPTPIDRPIDAGPNADTPTSSGGCGCSSAEIKPSVAGWFATCVLTFLGWWLLLVNKGRDLK